MSKERLISRLRNIPDYPVKGVQFKDVTSWFMNPDDLKEIVDSLYEKYKDKGITKVCGIESRGFIVGSILAYKLNAGFIPIRKPGKLPFEKVSVEYEKEYGQTGWRCTKTQYVQMMWCLYTTTCWQQEAHCLHHAILLRCLSQKGFTSTV